MSPSKSTIPASIKPFLFSLIVISSLSAKGLHLRRHFWSLSILDWIGLLPFLFCQDILLAIVGRLLLARSSRRWSILDCGILGLILTVVTGVPAAMEIAFYWKTGEEMDWSATGKFLRDPAGMKVLLSGMTTVLSVLALLIFLSKTVATPLYSFAGSSIHFAFKHSVQRIHDIMLHWQSIRYDGAEKGDKNFKAERIHALNVFMSLSTTSRLFRNTYPFALPFIYLAMLVLYVERSGTPYKHISGSLPFTLIYSSEPDGNEFCVDSDSLDRRPFPLDYVTGDKREVLAGWVPWESTSWKSLPLEPVDWLPEEPIAGFQRWYLTDSPSDAIFYDSRDDPLRVSNTDSPIVDTLREAVGNNNVKIRNVFMITLESTRKDVFPLKKSSRLYDTIISSHGKSAKPEISELLADISRSSEILTGESTGFEQSHGSRISAIGTWRNLSADFGGINILGAISSSTYTLKNLLISNCGVGPLPVDFAKESTLDIYQPCLPHVLKLFNNNKYSTNSPRIKDFRSQTWDTAYIQAVTDQYDDQSLLTEKMGFSEKVTRDQIRDSKSKFYPPKEPDSNYFGFPESQTKPYIRDIIEKARDSSRRFFISHLTSTTHHPWVLPPAFGKSQSYMGHKGWQDHNDINDYLNTVKYGDVWLGELMDMLEDTGVANETLVVILGDHGFAFREDDSSYSTYNGAHITNFRVPILFHHPALPRLHLPINASTMSVLPTILDLLSVTNSIDHRDQRAATQLLREYEGQSLIREFQTQQEGRRAWHFSLMNPGGGFFSVMAAGKPWRLVMPLCRAAVLRFTDIERDETEQEKVEVWDSSDLKDAVEASFGSEAATWVDEARAVATWWYWERRRLWKFRGSSQQTSPGLPDIALRQNTTGGAELNAG